MSLPVPWPNTNRICKSTATNNAYRRRLKPSAYKATPSKAGLPGNAAVSAASGNVIVKGYGLIQPSSKFLNFEEGVRGGEVSKTYIGAFRRAFLLPCFLALLLPLSACTSVRPIVKIGLIAPFEGLYRESGYAALEAMRQAMAECTPPGIDVLPLALDDSGDPAQAQRAAQKLLVDPTVRAVIGPLTFDTIPAVTKVISPAATIPWFVPSLVTEEGIFGAPTTSEWLEAQVDFIAASAPATRVLLLGLPTEWQIEINASVPTLRVDDLDTAFATIEEGDALLWLGRPDAGERWLASLHQANPTVGFWLAEQAGINIFAAHSAQIEDRKNIHWLLWKDSDYNAWSNLDDSAIQPSDAMRHLTYRATCTALNDLVEKHPATSTRWQLQSQPFEQVASE